VFRFRKRKYYNDCKLPVGIFIHVITTGDVEALNITGEAPFDELQTAWGNIIEEYAKLTKSPEYEATIETMRSFAVIQARAVMLNAAVSVLYYKHDHRCVDVLREAGYTQKFDINEPIQYWKDLDIVSKRIKAVNIQLEQKAKEFEEIGKNAEAPDADKWFQNIAIISKFMGFHIDVNVITLREYVGYQTLLEKHNESIKQSNVRTTD